VEIACQKAATLSAKCRTGTRPTSKCLVSTQLMFPEIDSQRAATLSTQCRTGATHKN
jgi:hypothetical protein